MNLSVYPQAKPAIHKPQTSYRIGVTDCYDPIRTIKGCIDLNMDGCIDLVHGHFVETVIKANMHYNPVIIRYDVDKEKGRTFENISSALTKAVKEKDTFDAFNLSMGEDIEIKNLANVTAETVNPDRMVKYLTWMGEKVVVDIISLLSSIGESTKTFIAAGNGTEKNVSAFSAAKNTISVGNFRSFSEKEPSSADNALVNVFAQGVYTIKPLYEGKNLAGFDINDDFVPDIPLSMVKGHETIEKYRGKSLDTLLATQDDHMELIFLKDHFDDKPIDLSDDRFAPFKNKLFSLKEIFDWENFSEDVQEKIYESGEYGDLESVLSILNSRVYYHTKAFNDQLAYSKKPTILFKTDESGNLIYSPLSPDKLTAEQVGTSFSSPTALAQVADNDIARNEKAYLV